MSSSYRDIPGYVGLYAVNKQGNVRSHRKNKLLAPITNRDGYTQVSLSFMGKVKIYYVHQLVTRTFLGERPPKFTINHKNGKKSDNRLSNLEYVSYSDNNLHSYRVLNRKFAGAVGEQQWNHKLTGDYVRQIRSLYEQGESPTNLANRFNVTRENIYQIVHYRSWVHIK